MRILILTQWFDPEPFTFKGLAFARELVKRGHEVEVLTGFPNYPNGELYPGYKVRPWQRETMEGIRVNRVALYPSHDGSGLRRSLNYLSFAATAATLGPLVTRKPDVVYVHNLVTLGFACAILQALKGCPYVLDVQDLWPDSVAESGMLRASLPLKLLNRFSNAVYNRAAHVTTLSPGIRTELIRRGLPGDKVSVVYNWCDEASMRPAPRDATLAAELGLEGRFIVLFAGTMGTVQGLQTVLDAAALIGRSLPNVSFVLIGGGVRRDALEQEARERGLGNVLFLPRRPARDMPAILGLADVLLVHLKDTPLFRITIPSKTQAYLAAGKPIVMAVAGDAADLVTRAGAGLACAAGDASAMADAVAQLYRMPHTERQRMGERGAAFYAAELCMARGVEKFEEVFEAAVTASDIPHE